MGESLAELPSGRILPRGALPRLSINVGQVLAEACRLANNAPYEATLVGYCAMGSDYPASITYQTK